MAFLKWIFFFGLTIVCMAEGQDILRMVAFSTKGRLANNNLKPCIVPGSYQCVDCKTVQVCLGRDKFERYNCSQNEKCDSTDGCSTTAQCNAPSVPQGAEDPNYICTGEGLFPDASKCRQFYFCDKGKGYRYKCDDDSHFDAESLACMQPNCPVENEFCKDRSFGHVNIGGEFFTLCIAGEPKLVFKCPANQTFDSRINMCAPTCTEADEKIGSPDCQSFFTCDSAKTVTGKRKCAPEGKSYFNPTSKKCEIYMTGRPEYCKK